MLPAHLVIAGAALVIAIFAGRVAWFAASESHFFGDDLYSDWLGRTVPFAQFVLTPIDVHVVWLHRAVTYAMNQLFPLSFEAAVAALLAFHALGVLVMARVVGRLVSPPVTWVLLTLYCTSPFLLSLFTWWTAGLHRLPYVLAMLTAVWAYLELRERPALRWALLIAGAMLFGLGFYAKAALLPLVLLGLEVSLGGRGAPGLGRRLLLVMCLSVVAVAYARLWTGIVHVGHQPINPDLGFYVEFVSLSWQVLLGGLVGVFYDGSSVPTLVGGTALLLFAAITVYRCPKSGLAWMVWAALVTANFVVTALPKFRTDAFGLSIAVVSDRYYYELSFVTVLFAAVALHHAGAMATRRGSGTRRGALGAVGTVAALALLASHVHARSVARFDQRSADQARARQYLERFTADLHRLEQAQDGPLTFRNGHTPGFFSYWGEYRTHAGLLLISGADAKVVRRGKHRFRIARDGSIRVDKRRRRKKRPRRRRRK